MTKENLTSINVIIDESGSMDHLASDTIGSFNTFLADQKLAPGEAVFTLCTFSSDYRLVHDFVQLAGVPALDNKTYRPGGMTALLDAMGTTMNSVGAKLAAMPEEERPSKVIFMIITDGQENSSHRFTRDQIKSMVEHQRSTYQWEFVFMGANIDAITEGTSLGISASNSMNYSATSDGTQQLYENVSGSLKSYRGGVQSQVNFFNQPTTGKQAAPSVPPLVDNLGNPIPPTNTGNTGGSNNGTP
jgi:hypothetical protein